VGFAYKNSILVPARAGSGTVYSGKIRGKQASFAVSADKTVLFRYGDRTYGPYIVREDPAAIPKDPQLSEAMTGVELRRGEEILFRGGVLSQGGSRLLYNSDGSIAGLGIWMTENGSETDLDGNAVDPMEPGVSEILDLAEGPVLTHKGEWLAWLAGVFVCAVAAVSVLFADELFRWNLSFLVRNAKEAEPADWEITSRYVSWTLLPALALVIFLLGLR
jgi:hypothetical protein